MTLLDARHIHYFVDVLDLVHFLRFRPLNFDGLDHVLRLGMDSGVVNLWHLGSILLDDDSRHFDCLTNYPRLWTLSREDVGLRATLVHYALPIVTIRISGVPMPWVFLSVAF